MVTNCFTLLSRKRFLCFDSLQGNLKVDGSRSAMTFGRELISELKSLDIGYKGYVEENTANAEQGVPTGFQPVPSN